METSHLLAPPLLKLRLQMIFQFRKLIPKTPPTPPANQIIVQKPRSPSPPHLSLTQRKLLHIHQKLRREAIIMLSMPHALTMAVPAQNVDM